MEDRSGGARPAGRPAATMTAFARDTMLFARAVAAYSGRKGIATTMLVGIGAILDGTSIVLVVPLLATLFETGGSGTAPGWAGGLIDLLPGDTRLDKLLAILALIGVVMVGRAIVAWGRGLMLGQLQVGFVAEQRMRIARGLANADWSLLSRLSHGRVSHLMSGDIQRCGAGAHFLMQIGVAIVMMAAQTAFAFVLSPRLTALALVLIVLGAMAMSGLLGRSRDAGRVVTQANQDLAVNLGRFLGGMKMAKSQDLHRAFVAEFEHSIAGSAERQAAFAGQQAMLGGLWTLLAAAVAGTAVAVGYAVFDLTPAILLALLVLLSRIAAPAAQLHAGLQQIAFCLPAWREIEAMQSELAAAAAPLATEAGLRVPDDAAIVFEKVSYGHGAGHIVLEGIDFEIRSGEFLGLTGASGAGKTTIVDLLTGLVAPQSGRIKVGDVALNDIDIADWRRRLAYITQDAVLFNDSIRRNLQWMCPDADDRAMLAALDLAGAGPWFARLPDGFDTVLGATGSLVSGGERQRLALARAMLRKPSLLILDEATSAIDVAGERAILERLAALSPRPTIIIIAHRTESVALCDRVVRLASGRVAPANAHAG